MALGRADPFAGEPGHAGRRAASSRPAAITTPGIGCGQIACPILIAAGRYDGIALPADTGAHGRRGSRARSLHFFEGGHLFLCQDRRAFVGSSSS